jgi:hypothetical protein
MCPPALRPAVVVLLAMMAADGTSVLRNVYVINRGYEDLAERLNSVGAQIEIFRDMCWARGRALGRHGARHLNMPADLRIFTFTALH